jgi:hypothetical protein
LRKISQALNFLRERHDTIRTIERCVMVDTGRGNAGGGGAGLSGGEFAGVGLQFALVILVFTGVGYWLDKRFHSSPWFLLLGVLVGGGGGFYSIVRKATDATRRDEARRKAAKGGGSGGTGS